MTLTITDQNHIPELIARLAILNAAHVLVGILGDSSKNARHGEGGEATNAEIAAAHEFGTDHIDRRPFLAPAMDKGAKEIADLQADLIGRVLDGTMTPDQALGILGELGVVLIKAEITGAPHPPALKPATIKAKGSSRPLIDTGQMLNSVTYKIIRSGGGGRG